SQSPRDRHGAAGARVPSLLDGPSLRRVRHRDPDDLRRPVHPPALRPLTRDTRHGQGALKSGVAPFTPPFGTGPRASGAAGHKPQDSLGTTASAILKRPPGSGSRGFSITLLPKPGTSGRPTSRRSHRRSRWRRRSGSG